MRGFLPAFLPAANFFSFQSVTLGSIQGTDGSFSRTGCSAFRQGCLSARRKEIWDRGKASLGKRGKGRTHDEAPSQSSVTLIGGRGAFSARLDRRFRTLEAQADSDQRNVGSPYRALEEGEYSGFDCAKIDWSLDSASDPRRNRWQSISNLPSDNGSHWVELNTRLLASC